MQLPLIKGWIFFGALFFGGVPGCFFFLWVAGAGKTVLLLQAVAGKMQNC